MEIKEATSTHPNPSRQTIDLWPDFASIVGVGRNSIYAAAKRGDFRTIRIGKKIVISKAEVDRLLTEGGRRPARPTRYRRSGRQANDAA